ncbi:hydroxymethylglutaryl-CoA lyase [Metabacillus litoralis]|uniref:hydroxymethylglutaryl-CoA lyase n=1 Tax=Metabacillus litoralis TaxID=152268 RepID=UPI00203C9D80|nr:hydroxymethylglutaryl-CoA lyase [Metabacillus litoralis]
MKWPQSVSIKEVGPRDGLQNEKKCISTEDKIQWINQLSHTGLSYIEITSFVHPKWIPALADAYSVAKGIKRVEGVTYAALVPNQKGLEKALDANIDEVSIFLSASETHNRKNINKSINETLAVLSDVVQESLTSGKSVRGYISTVFGCPYEGRVSLQKTMSICEELFEMGVYEVSLGDTIGVATPKQVQEVTNEMLKRFHSDKLAMHFHDTRGTALANVTASLSLGITRFDSSIGGLGGCPYAPGASGNVATDDLLYMLEGMEIETGLSKDKIHNAALFIQERIGRSLASHSLQVYQAKPS